MMIPVGGIILRNALAVSAFIALGAHAPTELRYRTTGEDLYRVGSAAPTQISYSGTQSLSIGQSGPLVRFVAQADCTRDNAGARTIEHARFVQELLADGSFHDRMDGDPDFLTILNQPFAIRLDAATVRDLRELHAPVPFAAASPVGGGNLEGALRPGSSGFLNGRPVIGVEFRAEGTVNGALPGQTTATIEGTIHLDGTAYYDRAQALLLALDARLTIDGALGGAHLASVPVRIVYDRAIKLL